MTAVIQPDEGARFDSMGDSMRFVLTSATTDNQYTLIEDTIKPGMHAKLHLHREHAEAFYVIEGQVEWTLGTQTVVTGPGSTIYVAPNIPHAAKADQHGKMLTLWTPGGLEELFYVMRGLTPEQLNDPAIFSDLAKQYDIVDLAVAPLPQLISFYDLLLSGNVDALVSIFAEQPQLNTPLQGAIVGYTALNEFVQQQQAWLSERQAQTEFVDIVLDSERVVVELVVHLFHNQQTIALPVALVADLVDSQITALRIYHSTWPLTGQHIQRDPLLTPQADLVEPAIIEDYMHALEQGDISQIMALFAPDGCIREPSGAEFTHIGAAARQAFYDQAFAHGGVMLHHCSATVDGQRFAVEYICDRWGHQQLPAQAGMAVYTWNADNQLTAVHIYDDVTPPHD